MKKRSGNKTSLTLLEKIRTSPLDHTAWAEFVSCYRPVIYSFCLDRTLQPSDAEDVTQNVLAKLLVKMREFRYDPASGFRAWLKVVTANAVNDYLADHRRERGSGDSDILRVLDNVEARESLVGRIEASFDRELFLKALDCARAQVSDLHWNAFSLTALEGRSGAEAAAQLGMLVGTVYSARSKVQKLIRDEIQRLEDTNPLGIDPLSGPNPP